MAFGKEWYERRKQITKNYKTGIVCNGCKLETTMDTIINVSFCGCGYRQQENQEQRRAQ
jgi:hypothetical protein